VSSRTRSAGACAACNGPQFVAKDFKEFIRLCGMSHVRTSPFYPQSNGKWERWARSLKHECVRPKTPLSVHHARTIVGGWVNYYCDGRLPSALGYIAPKDKLEGREKTIFAPRDRKLEQARERRKLKRQEVPRKEATIGTTILTSETIGNTTCSAGETDAGSAGLRRAVGAHAAQALALRVGPAGGSATRQGYPAGASRNHLAESSPRSLLSAPNLSPRTPYASKNSTPIDGGIPTVSTSLFVHFRLNQYNPSCREFCLMGSTGKGSFCGPSKPLVGDENVHYQRMDAKPAVAIKFLDRPRAQKGIEDRIGDFCLGFAPVDSHEAFGFLFVGNRLGIVKTFAQLSLILRAQIVDSRVEVCLPDSGVRLPAEQCQIGSGADQRKQVAEIAPGGHDQSLQLSFGKKVHRHARFENLPDGFASLLMRRVVFFEDRRVGQAVPAVGWNGKLVGFVGVGECNGYTTKIMCARSDLNTLP